MGWSLLKEDSVTFCVVHSGKLSEPLEDNSPVSLLAKLSDSDMRAFSTSCELVFGTCSEACEDNFLVAHELLQGICQCPLNYSLS